MSNLQEIMRQYDEAKFVDLTEQMTEMYRDALSRAEERQKKLASFNEAEEIRRREAEIKRLCTHSLLFLSDKELAAARDFRQRHRQQCGNKNHFIYDLTNTEMGTAIHIKCPICNESEDITDVDGW